MDSRCVFIVSDLLKNSRRRAIKREVFRVRYIVLVFRSYVPVRVDGSVTFMLRSLHPVPWAYNVLGVSYHSIHQHQVCAA